MSSSPGNLPAPMDPVVSVAWLAAHLQQPGLVLVDATMPPVGVLPVVDTRARYLSQHLPGAVFFDIEELSDHTTSLPHMLPDETSFSQNMAAMGIGEGSTVVVYEQEGVFSAPRAWWMLRTLGAEPVYLLEGGLRAWMEAGYPVEAGEVRRTPTIFRAHRRVGAGRSFAEVQTVLQAGKADPQGEQIVDARPAGRFTGAAPEPRPGIRSGHMPGSLSVPSGTLLEGGKLKSPAEAQEVFATAGVDLQRPITTTCGSGVTAAILALQLERIGVAGVRLYDGSWAEYAQQPEAVIVADE